VLDEPKLAHTSREVSNGKQSAILAKRDWPVGTHSTQSFPSSVYPHITQLWQVLIRSWAAASRAVLCPSGTSQAAQHVTSLRLRTDLRARGVSLVTSEGWVPFHESPGARRVLLCETWCFHGTERRDRAHLRTDAEYKGFGRHHCLHPTPWTWNSHLSIFLPVSQTSLRHRPQNRNRGVFWFSGLYRDVFASPFWRQQISVWLIRLIVLQPER
jgi:hypothetical protein